MKYILCALLMITGCAQQDAKRFMEKATAEERARSRADREVQKDRAVEMEFDLERRHRFYKSLSGDFEGVFTTRSGATFATKVKLIPSLPPYVPSSRVRTVEEVASDINNLYFNIQVLHWNPEIPDSAASCVFQEVRGDLDKGRIDIAQSACANVYSVRIVGFDRSMDSASKLDDIESSSKALAKSILEGRVQYVDFLRVYMQPANSAQEYILELRRAAK